jgi:glycosyltransferase involved in cell wall biosynthesis
MEALACGCPVVGSASGGVTELVSQESGVLIKAPVDWHTMITPTGSELAEAVLKIMSDFETYARVARARAEALFDRKHWVARHREIFEQLIRKDVA